METEFPSGCGVYAIINKITKRCYVGSSAYMCDRVFSHMSKLKNKKHPSWRMQYDFDKYGEKSFTFKVLRRCQQRFLMDRERDFHTKMKPSYCNLQLCQFGSDVKRNVRFSVSEFNEIIGIAIQHDCESIPEAIMMAVRKVK